MMFDVDTMTCADRSRAEAGLGRSGTDAQVIWNQELGQSQSQSLSRCPVTFMQIQKIRNYLL